MSLPARVQRHVIDVAARTAAEGWENHAMARPLGASRSRAGRVDRGVSIGLHPCRAIQESERHGNVRTVVSRKGPTSRGRGARGPWAHVWRTDQMVGKLRATTHPVPPCSGEGSSEGSNDPMLCWNLDFHTECVAQPQGARKHPPASRCTSSIAITGSVEPKQDRKRRRTGRHCNGGVAERQCTRGRRIIVHS